MSNEYIAQEMKFVQEFLAMSAFYNVLAKTASIVTVQKHTYCQCERSLFEAKTIALNKAATDFYQAKCRKELSPEMIDKLVKDFFQTYDTLFERRKPSCQGDHTLIKGVFDAVHRPVSEYIVTALKERVKAQEFFGIVCWFFGQLQQVVDATVLELRGLRHFCSSQCGMSCYQGQSKLILYYHPYYRNIPFYCCKILEGIKQFVDINTMELVLDIRYVDIEEKHRMLDSCICDDLTQIDSVVVKSDVEVTIPYGIANMQLEIKEK